MLLNYKSLLNLKHKIYLKSDFTFHKKKIFLKFVIIFNFLNYLRFTFNSIKFSRDYILNNAEMFEIL